MSLETRITDLVSAIGADIKTLTTGKQNTLVSGTNIKTVGGVSVVGSGNVDSLDINGGTIDGTVIGGVVPAAGSFTTLSASGNTTLGDSAADSVTIPGRLSLGSATLAAKNSVNWAGGAPSLTAATQAAFQVGSTGLSSLAITNIASGDFSVSLQAKHTTVDGLAYPLNLNPLGGNVNVTNLNSGPLAGFRNRIINGGFDVWQRGTSGFAINTYTADRWFADAGASVSRSTDAPTGFTYSLKHTAVAANAVYRQAIELPATGVQGDYYDGAVFTCSFWCKTSVAGKQLTLYAAFGVSAASPSLRTVVSNIFSATTTTWTKYSCTFSIPAGASVATANCLQIVPFVTSPSCDVYITGIQLEPGTVATPFEARPYSVELALCQRYCRPVGIGLSGFANGTTTVVIAKPFELPMFGAPSVVPVAGTNTVFNGGNVNSTSTPIIGASSANGVTLTYPGFTGLTLMTPVLLVAAPAHLLVSEL